MLNSLKVLIGSLIIFTATTYAQEADSLSKTNNKLTELSGVMQSINEELNAQRSNLGSIKAQVNARDKKDQNFQANVLRELRQLRRQYESLNYELMKKDNGSGANGQDMTATAKSNYSQSSPDGKMIFGEDEFIYVKEANAFIDARIDTGAAVSSISAQNITEFERNGKKWYRFTIATNDRFIEVEAPHVRYSDIRQSSKETVTKRPVVRLNVKIGDYSAATEFTLTDRSKLNYALLIGRTFIQDIAVVDVSRDHVQERDPEVLVLLSRDDYKKAKEEGKNPNAEYDRKNDTQAGKIAYPSDAYGSNLGDKAEEALPAIIEKRNDAKQE